MPGAGNEDRVEILRADHSVDVRVNEVQPRRCSPLTQQTRLDVLSTKWFTQERVGEQVDLSDGQIVRGSPVGVDQVQIIEHRHSPTKRRKC